MKTLITSVTKVPWKAVESSNLEAYHYEASSRHLYMKFKKGKAFYVYMSVEPSVIEQFEQAESYGKFFLAYIRDNFAFSKFEI